MRSDLVTMVLVESREDSLFSPPALVGIQRLRYRVLKNYVGKPDGKVMRLDTWNAAGGVDPDIRTGDTLLWLREVNIDDGAAGQETLRWDYVFDLSDLHRTKLVYPLTRDFRVLHDGPSMLEVIARRIEMMRAGKPLGDSRRLTQADFARGRGQITRWMPPESEAERATWGMSINTLSYPADADLFPVLMEETRDPSPQVRASAAQALAQYPGKQTMKRLTELLADEGTRREIHGHSGKADTIQAPIVKQAAREALLQLKSPGSVRGSFPY